METKKKRDKTLTMHSYRNSGVSVCALLRPKMQDEEVSPVYWRVIYKRKQKHYFTGLSFSKAEWGEFVETNKAKHRDDKATLQKYFDNVLRKSIDGLTNNGVFSFEALNVALDKGDATSLISVLNAKIAKLASDGRIRHSGIHEGTLRALKRFKHYSKLNKKDRAEFAEKCIADKYVSRGKNKLIIEDYDINFDEITPSFLNNFDLFLRETGAVDSTIGMYMRTLRSVINRNDEAGEPYLSGAKYPFGAKKGKYRIPESKRKNLAIPIEDIWKIESFTTDNLRFEFAKDVFTFLFYASGLNFGDFCRLKYENINHITGELEIKRKKTNRANSKNEPPTVYIPLIPPLLEIINKYGNKETDGYIFPMLNGLKSNKAIIDKISVELEAVNKPLKTIAASLGLVDISTSTARNSYMTHLETELMYSPNVTKQMVGHKVSDVTGGYVNLNPKKRLEINSKLLNPGKSYETIIRPNFLRAI